MHWWSPWMNVALKGEERHADENDQGDTNHSDERPRASRDRLRVDRRVAHAG